MLPEGYSSGDFSDAGYEVVRSPFFSQSAEPADTFAKQQKFVKPLMPYEFFMANIEAGNDDQILIKSLVESYQLRISANKGPNCVCAISTKTRYPLRWSQLHELQSQRACTAEADGISGDAAGEEAKLDILPRIHNR